MLKLKSFNKKSVLSFEWYNICLWNVFRLTESYEFYFYEIAWLLWIVLSIFLKFLILFIAFSIFSELMVFVLLWRVDFFNVGKFKELVITYSFNRIYRRGFFANLNNSSFYFNVNPSVNVILRKFNSFVCM